MNAAGIDSLASQYGTQSSEEQNKEAKELVKSVQNNFCAVYIKQEKWDKVVIAASKVIKMSPEGEPNVKALYRRAQAYHNLGEAQKAAQDLDVAMSKAPQGKNDEQIHSLGARSIPQLDSLLTHIHERFSPTPTQIRQFEHLLHKSPRPPQPRRRNRQPSSKDS